MMTAPRTWPLWQDAPAATPRAAPLPSTVADVAVVGGGLTGLSAAYHLTAARPGRRVVLLEADQLGAGASGRNTGMLGPGVGQSLPALVRRLGESRAAALYRETLAAVTAVQTLVERERIDCELQMTGQLLRARSKGDRRRLAQQTALMRDLDLPVEVLDDQAAQAALRLPAPGGDHDGPAALRLPHAGLLHPGKLVAGLAAAAAARGATLISGARVVSIDSDRGGTNRPVRLSLAGGGEVLADQVVVATAGYTARMGLLQARVLPVHLQALATAPLSGDMLAALGWARREGVVEARRLFNYFRLTADNRLVFGGAAPRYHWRGRPPTASAEDALSSLRRELRAVFPAATGVADLAITHVWTGVIGYTMDALPALGRDRHRPAIVHAVGWCGHGLALSVASGAWITQMIDRPHRDQQTEPAPLAWFRDAPPALPGEALRWLSFKAAVRAMALADRIA